MARRLAGSGLEPPPRLARAAVRGGQCARPSGVVVVGIVRYSPPPALSLALRRDWQARAPLPSTAPDPGGVTPCSLLWYKLFGHMEASPWWCDLLQSCLKVTGVRSWRRSHTHSLVWAFLSRSPVLTVGSFTGTASCQQLTKSSLGIRATFLISSSPWRTIPSPSLSLMTPVRVFLLRMLLRLKTCTCYHTGGK